MNRQTTGLGRPRWAVRLLCLAALTAALAACGGGSIRPGEPGVEAPDHFAFIVQAFKGNQFIIDGAVVGPRELDGHLAYLASKGQLPASVLLQRSNESKVNGAHLRELTRLQAHYGFKAYVEHDGNAVPLHPEP